MDRAFGLSQVVGGFVEVASRVRAKAEPPRMVCMHEVVSVEVASATTIISVWQRIYI